MNADLAKQVASLPVSVPSEPATSPAYQPFIPLTTPAAAPAAAPRDTFLMMAHRLQDSQVDTQGEFSFPIQSLRKMKNDPGLDAGVLMGYLYQSVNAGPIDVSVKCGHADHL